MHYNRFLIDTHTIIVGITFYVNNKLLYYVIIKLLILLYHRNY